MMRRKVTIIHSQSGKGNNTASFIKEKMKCLSKLLQIKPHAACKVFVYKANVFYIYIG